MEFLLLSAGGDGAMTSYASPYTRNYVVKVKAVLDGEWRTAVELAKRLKCGPGPLGVCLRSMAEVREIECRQQPGHNRMVYAYRRTNGCRGGTRGAASVPQHLVANTTSTRTHEAVLKEKPGIAFRIDSRLGSRVQPLLLSPLETSGCQGLHLESNAITVSGWDRAALRSAALPAFSKVYEITRRMIQIQRRVQVNLRCSDA